MKGRKPTKCIWHPSTQKEIPRKAFLLISVSLCLANARALELLSLRTPGIAASLFFVVPISAMKDHGRGKDVDQRVKCRQLPGGKVQ